MANGKLDYRAIKWPEAGALFGMKFRFRIKKLETDFMMADGSVHTFPNWDIKNCRERYYMEEFINVPVEEYLRMATESGEIVEYGIKTSDIKKFIAKKADFFETLIFNMACGDDDKLDADEDL